MRKRILLVLPLLMLSACADKPGSTSAISRPLAKGEYAIEMEGKPGMSLRELKKTVNQKAREVCKEKWPLMRRWREDEFRETAASMKSPPDHYIVKAEVECT